MVDIQLIKAPCNETGMPEDKWYMPLNLLWLAAYLERYGYTTEILDGQHLNVQEIKDRINTNIIGISLDVLSVKAFNEIVQYAKNEKGCTVVAGGQYATPLAEQILKVNYSVDYVIRYDGEESLFKLVEKISKNDVHNLADISNLTWRSREGVKHNPILDVKLTELPLPRRDIGGLDIENYINCFNATKDILKLPFSYKRPTNTFSIKGCPRRVGDKGCSFCSRIDTHVRPKNPQHVFNELKYLEETFNIDYISDFSDNWLIVGWLKQLVNIYEKTGGIKARLRIYADPRDINESTLVYLKILGVDTVLLGIESGDDEILALNGKNMQVDNIKKAVKLLCEHDIKVSDAYVLGMIGETRKSVEKTIDLAKHIREICTTEISYWNILTPLPGSKAWKMLFTDQAIKRSLGTSYEFDTVQLEKTFVKRFSKLGESGYEFLQSIRNEMLANSNIASREFIPTHVDIGQNNLKRKGGCNG